MEDGSRGGSGDRRDASQRRKTVSGVLRPHRQDSWNDDGDTSPEGMRLPWSSPSASAPTSPTAPSLADSPRSHKRTVPGSILQRLNFLRGGSEDGRPPSREKEMKPPKSPKSSRSPRRTKSRKSIDDEPPITSPTSPKLESALVFALLPNKTRKRKGSLRKTALLSGRRLSSEGRDRKNSVSAKSPLSRLPLHQAMPSEASLVIPSTARRGDFESSRAYLQADSPNDGERKFSYEQSIVPSSSDSGWSDSAAVTAARLTLVTEHQSHHCDPASSASELSSPLDIRSPTSQASYISTTDDDDVLTFDRPAKSFPVQSGASLPKPTSSTATSYFPDESELSLPQRRTTSRNKRSPLSHTISSSSVYPPSPPPHDYTETEYWGWVILFVTWLTFTVGMGSCLDIWSWAWDVGNKPYAPPELEDDPTLPIVGYYPALIVLTGVVVWVWITVAWVGMKYFRHAKIEV
ncbi:hypothetical protein BAUCODRAFT_258500 [Baudoinia panamericana UAMH 10762]|uniref:Uncharacterized protein n=1 Tax=Baudoinia panamericana (strain UAMH 10762) TaxID=717646 RepID=M2M8I2_BAUPA|nr:uncharacterized protein BAUCODRAFT_258500 [Baudoinia panamericana UAMH 10762]EMC92696.1 hypothetical protein BAUCODRAFT_258500 [Baudoinia panamericana UAMH 10762]